MSRKKISGPAMILFLCGAVMLAFSLARLYNTAPLLQYAVSAPIADNQGAHLDTFHSSVNRAEDQLSESVSAIGCFACKSNASIRNKSAMLYAVDLCWQNVMPREMRSGRWMDSTELNSGSKLIVLDEDLAFEIFGSEEAEGKEVDVEGAPYRVIGIAKHRRTPGETNPYGAYIPLMAANAQGLQTDSVVMCALSTIAEGADEKFKSVMQSLWGNGNFYDLKKEAMRGAILPGFAALVLLLSIWRRALAKWRTHARRQLEAIREMREHYYFQEILGAALRRIFPCILYAAVLLAALYVVLRIAVKPLYVFTEWIPESFVDVAAIKRVFWNVTSDAARIVKIGTVETANITFYSTLTRWGTLLVLLSCWKDRKAFRVSDESN